MKQWYSAQELVGVAGLSRNDRNIRRMGEKEGWYFQSLSRSASGQGAGKEYAYASLPQGVQAALALRWWAAETEDGPIAKSQGRRILSHSARLGELCPAKKPQQSQGAAAHGCIDGTTDLAGKRSNPQASDCDPAKPRGGS